VSSKTLASKQEPTILDLLSGLQDTAQVAMPGISENLTALNRSCHSLLEIIRKRLKVRFNISVEEEFCRVGSLVLYLHVAS
jgi:hypothetical protein